MAQLARWQAAKHGMELGRKNSRAFWSFARRKTGSTFQKRPGLRRFSLPKNDRSSFMRARFYRTVKDNVEIKKARKFQYYFMELIRTYIDIYRDLYGRLDDIFDASRDTV